jgi:hypothetical protein
MNTGNRVLFGAGAVCLGLMVSTFTGAAQNAPQSKPAAPKATTAAKPAPGAPKPAVRAAATAPAALESHNAVIKQYCVTCHNERRKATASGLSLETFDITKAAEHREIAEKMIVKLQAGMMPPPGARRPEPAVLSALVTGIESTVDAHAAANPNPGVRPFQRLNRAEYARAINELLELKVDAGKWLPLDTMSANFDNIADAQPLSATLLESYLNAASAISRMAVGDRKAKSTDEVYSNASYVSQHPWDHVEGAPFGTRGGIVVNHVFPADGEYIFSVALNSGDGARYEDVDVSIDGERAALLPYETLPAGGADGRGAVDVRTEPIFVKAGQQRVSAAFVKKLEGPYEDLIRPHDWSYAGGGSGGGGITNLPHLRDLIITGPIKTTGVSETPARQKIFTCRPTSGDEELRCAREIITKIATEAYRRPATLREVDKLVPFYEKGAKAEGFEGGVRTALEAILASPYFIFRLEREPNVARAGNTYRVADVDLASRLSFFLWGTPPDEELVAAATSGKLATTAGLERQVKKMLADPRAQALGTRFAAQWLRLQDIDKVHPDPNFYPNFDDNLAHLMRQETVLFFNTLVREDRSLLDLYRADFTVINERLARHYGIPGVSGPQFRKVQYPDETRRGILGQGSVLVQTSLANRTSPVLRGKWVMEVMMGTPPPPPPPDANPDLENVASEKDGRMLTTRERMEMHRANPTCNACHRFMDPIGLALDNFDVTAKWRQRENGSELDTRGDYYDGTKITRPAELVAALLNRPEPLVRTFTENLMAYALGRRVEYFDQPAIRTIARNAAKDDYRMSSFILGVVKSDAFRMKRAEAATSTTEAGSR